MRSHRIPNVPRPPCGRVSPSETLIAAAVLAVVAASAPAQRQFDELRKRALPPEKGFTRALASGDVDGDGDLDVMVGNGGGYPRGGQTLLFLNDGTGVYADATARSMPVDSDFTLAVALGDVDGDGDLDAVLGNQLGPSSSYYGGQNRLYLNDGTGTFTDATAARMPPNRDFTTAVELGDVDGDGDLDIVFGSGAPSGYRNDTNRLYLNDGTGRFSDATFSHMLGPSEFTSAVAMGDVDGDGDLDIAFGNGSFGFYRIEQSRLYLNDGTGHYSDATAARMPARRGLTYALSLGDVDGDGDLDMVSGNYQQQNRLYLNDGTGTFANDVTGTRLPADGDATRAAVLGDVDGDGDLDLIFGNGSIVDGQQNRLYLNDGTGAYTDATATRVPSYIDGTRALAPGDVDGDGDLDLIVGNSSFDGTMEDRLFINDGSGSFVDATATPLPLYSDSTFDLAVGDVDGDGDLDLAVANGGAGQDRVYLNDGTGTYTDASAALSPAGSRSSSVALGDVDGDGDLDLVFGSGRQNRLYLNDGRGGFTDVTATRMPVDSDATNAVALGDVDGDGDLDVVFGNMYQTGGQNTLYLNDGTGTYSDVTAARMPAVHDGTLAIALGDVDGDGDLDMVTGNWAGNYGQQNRLYLNDGTGTYTQVTAARMPPGRDRTRSVALGDVDADGDVDLVFGNAGQNKLYLNNGAGTYTDATTARLPAHGDWSSAVALGDVDGDGDLDFVSGNSYYFGDSQNRLYLNDGTGTFADATSRMLADHDTTTAVALGDVDGDGDLDIVLGAAYGQGRILQNLLRQLDAPQLLRIGRTYQLDAYARYGVRGLVDVALPLLSTATANIPLPPFGTLGLAPAQAVAAAPFVIPRPSGVGSITFTVPNVAGLAGLPVYAQALLVPYPFQARLTNVTRDVGIR